MDKQENVIILRQELEIICQEIAEKINIINQTNSKTK